MIREPYSLYPTSRERDRMIGAARTRTTGRAIFRQMRRERVIRAAMQRLENPDHFPHGPEIGWRARENARIYRMLNATRTEAFSAGHASGYRFAGRHEAPRAVEPQREAVA